MILQPLSPMSSSRSGISAGRTARAPRSLLAALVFALLTSPAHAVPTTLTYVGRLENGDGPVSAAVDVTFKIFDDAVAGSSFYTETVEGLVVVGGELVAELGANALDASILERPELWLEITVDGDVLEPRVRLTSVPYALRASLAEVAEEALTFGGLVPTDVVTQAQLAQLGLSSGLTAGAGLARTGDVLSVAAAGVTSDMIQAEAIGADHLGLDVVDSLHLRPSGVDERALADAAVTSSKLAAGAVDTLQLADASVTSIKLAVGAIGATQLADASVSATKLAAGAVGTNALAAGAVTAVKLASLSVGTLALVDGAVTSAKLGSSAVGTAALADGAVTSAKLASSAVGTSALADGAVTATKLATASVGSAAIADFSIASSDLAAGAVTTLKLASDAVDSLRILNGTVLSEDLAASSVLSSHIKDGTIATADLGTNSVDSAAIKDGSVTTADLAAGAVDGTVLKDGSVTAAKLASSVAIYRVTALGCTLDVSVLVASPTCDRTSVGCGFGQVQNCEGTTCVQYHPVTASTCANTLVGRLVP